MVSPVSYFFSDFNFKKQSKVFKACLYWFVIIKCIYWLINFSLLFGEHSIIYSKPSNIGLFRDLAFLLHAYISPGVGLMFLILTLLMCLAGVCLKTYYITDFILWFLVLNLHYKLYPMLTGGDFLLNQFLLFNCFLSKDHVLKKTGLNELRICLHNFGSLAVMTQMCMAYLISGITKLCDENWMSGNAVFMVSQVDHYSMYSFLRFSKDSVLATMLTYAVMFYQLLFPLLIWFSKVKKPFILIGAMIHLYIAFVMGLLSFGIIMLIGYIYFWPYKNKET